MELIFHPLVQRDLSQILSYYNLESGKALADRFFDEADFVRQQIQKEPTRFHLVDEIRRRANFPTFPYHFIYEIRSNKVRITILRHHKRHPTFGMRRN
jgi:plasmid stabilization system protein ParE